MSETTPEVMPQADDLMAALAALSGCVCESIDPICVCGLTLGDQYVEIGPDIDDCDDCGQAWVRIQSAYLGEVIGESTARLNPDCGSMLTLQLEVGAVRCVQMADDGEAFTADSLLAATNQQVRDMVALKNAILCCEHFTEYLLGQWTPLGPLGGLAGGFWTVEVVL